MLIDGITFTRDIVVVCDKCRRVNDDERIFHNLQTI